MLTDTGVPTPTQRRPEPPTLDNLRRELETLHGVLLHRSHVAEGYSLSGDAHTRDHWSAVAQTNTAAAALVARVLGWDEAA